LTGIFQPFEKPADEVQVGLAILNDVIADGIVFGRLFQGRLVQDDRALLEHLLHDVDDAVVLEHAAALVWLPAMPSCEKRVM
jgi:hypothetical protein